LLRPVRRRRFRAGEAPRLTPLEQPVSLWRSLAFEPVELHGTGPERLREFHRHYGEDVLRAARGGQVTAAAEAVARWIVENPPRPGDAWHPYTTSTRAGNWIAAISLAPELETRAVRESLWRQLAFVARNVEDDVLGNHVIRNARALVLGGVAFDAPQLVARGLALLERELPEQILSDGGHYERSPVYHLVVLRDLLEVAAVTGDSRTSAAIERMLPFAAALSRPDGRPALFNDGTLELAPQLDLPPAVAGLAVFPESGYAVVRRGRLWLAFDCGPPSPAYLPAHAHADALSFQLWLDDRPFVIDPGVSTYEPGPSRDWYRGTRAHATVSVDGDQFELWGAFRAGRLPRVDLLEASETRLEARVSYRGIAHSRRLDIGESELTVTDTIEGSGRHLVESSLPVAVGAAFEATTLDGRTAMIEPREVSETLFRPEHSFAYVQRGGLVRPAVLGWRVRLIDAATIAP
jgi:hypothetical protein